MTPTRQLCSFPRAVLAPTTPTLDRFGLHLKTHIHTRLQVGAYLLCGLRRLVSLYGVAGHARGLGLMGGLEVVADKESRRQAPVIAQ